MVYSSLGWEKAWWYCLPNLSLLAGVLLLLPACVSHPWLQGHVAPIVAAPSPASTLSILLQGAPGLPSPSTPWERLRCWETKSKFSPCPPHCGGSLIRREEVGSMSCRVTSLLLSLLPPTYRASPFSLSETSARTETEVLFQTLIFSAFFLQSTMAKHGMGSPLDMRPHFILLKWGSLFAFLWTHKCEVVWRNTIYTRVR